MVMVSLLTHSSYCQLLVLSIPISIPTIRSLSLVSIQAQTSAESYRSKCSTQLHLIYITNQKTSKKLVGNLSGKLFLVLYHNMIREAFNGHKR